MKKPTNKTADAAQAPASSVAPADRLLHFREVNALLGSRCKTGHSARAHAARGQIRAVRLNDRVVRYSEQSVRELIAGRTVP